MLKGEVLTRLDNVGNKSMTIFQVDGLLTAVQSPFGGYQTLSWTHTDPLGLSTSGDTKSVYDPLGKYISWQHAPTAPPNSYPPFSPSFGGLASAFGTSQDKSCDLNGIPISCSDLVHQIDIGNVAARFVTVSSQAALEYLDVDVSMLGSSVIELDYPHRDLSSSPGYLSLPQNPRQLTGAEQNQLETNLQKFLSDPDCGQFIKAMLGSLPQDVWKTSRYGGSLSSAFGRIQSNGGFWSGDTISKGALAITDPNTLTTTFDSVAITPRITGPAWQQFHATVILIHELTHVFTNAPNYGEYGHLQMAQAASDAAGIVGLDLSHTPGISLEFPTTKKYGTGDAYDLALSEYYNKTLSYACRKVKL